MSPRSYSHLLKRADLWLNANSRRYETVIQLSFACNVLLIGFSANGYARSIKADQVRKIYKPYNSDTDLFNDVGTLIQHASDVSDIQDQISGPGYVIGGDVHRKLVNRDGQHSTTNKYRYNDNTQ